MGDASATHPIGYRLSPTLGGFLGGQLGLLLFFFLFELRLFLLFGLVFILLAAFVSHRVSPFLDVIPSQVGEGSQVLPRIKPLYPHLRRIRMIEAGCSSFTLDLSR